MTALLGAAFGRLLGRRDRAVRAAAEAEETEKRASERSAVTGTALLEWIDDSERQQAELVHLRDRSVNGAGFRSSRGIAVGTAVLLTPSDGGAVKGLIRHSRRSAEGGFDHGIEVVRDERRRHDRAPMNQAAVLSVVGAGEAKLRVRIRDASECGLQLESGVDIAVDTPVRVAYLGWTRPGVVMHSRSHDGAFRIGIQFIGPVEPSVEE